MKHPKPIFFFILWLLLVGCTDDDPQNLDVEITFVATSTPLLTVETAVSPSVSPIITISPSTSLDSTAVLSTLPTSTLESLSPTEPTPGSTSVLSTPPINTVETPIAPAVCGPPAGWVLYTVRAGDTLFSLARRTGTTVTQVMQANCLSGDLIFAGQRLYLPVIPAPIVPPTAPLPNTATVEVPTAPPPGDPKLIIEPFSGPIGTTHTISIQEFKPEEAVTLQIIFVTTQEVIFSFSTTVDEMGNGQVEITTASTYPIGIYLVQAQGNMGTVDDEPFEVTP